MSELSLLHQSLHQSLHDAKDLFFFEKKNVPAFQDQRRSRVGAVKNKIAKTNVERANPTLLSARAFANGDNSTLVGPLLH